LREAPIVVDTRNVLRRLGVSSVGAKAAVTRL
jgi:hypothetical protein